MNELRFGIRTGGAAEREEEREVRRLLERAGPRPEMAYEDFAEIRVAAREEWRRAVDARSTRRRTLAPLALAASALLALAAGWWLWRAETPLPVETLATVERIEGAVGERLAVGDALAAGAVLATGAESPSRLSIRLADGHSVRLDAGSELRLVSPSSLELARGAVYVDSGLDQTAGGLVVSTEFGDVAEIGTQFEVRLAPGEGAALRVRVREGAISLRHDSTSLDAAAGEELTLGADGTVRRTEVGVHGAAWSWVEAAAPSLAIEGVRLGRYLEWVSRETGLSVGYEDPELAGAVAEIELHGTIEGLTPEESLRLVLPGAELGYRVEAGRLLVERGSE